MIECSHRVQLGKIFSLLIMQVTLLELMNVQLSEQRLLATKCCQYDEKFDVHLRKCYKSYKNKSNYSSEATASNLQVKNHAEIGWLPNYLQRGNISVRYAQLPNCSSRLTLHLVDPIPDRARLLPNGTLVLHSPTVGGAVSQRIFHPKEFCMDITGDNDELRRVFLLCPCDSLQCVSKCCSFGYAKTCEGSRCECRKHTVEWEPFHSENKYSSVDNVVYEILEANEPPCSNGSHMWFDNPIYRPHHIVRNWWDYPDGILFKNNLEKCGEIVTFNNSNVSYTTVGYCYLAFPFEGYFELGSMLHIPAAIFLALTMIILATVTDNRVSAYGWVHYRALQCHIASLLISNVILAIYYLISGNEVMFCLTTPIIMYFSLVSAAFWLNAICINMACGFWAQKVTIMTDRKCGLRIFLYYSLYSWGSSVIMTAFTASMWYAKEIPLGWLRPTLMETRRCFWENEDGSVRVATFAYFYGPLCALLLINATLFGFIACRVRGLRHSTSILQRKVGGSNGSFQFHRSALLYVKLLWLMGVAEMALELSAWAVNGEGFIYYIVADALDLLRATSICALCVCRPRVLRALRNRLRGCWTTLRNRGESGGGRGCGGEGNEGGGGGGGTVTLAERRGQRVSGPEYASSETVSSYCFSNGDTS